MRTISTTLRLLLLLIAVIPLRAQWTDVTPQGLHSNLWGAYFTDENTGWVVGWGATSGYSDIGKTTNGGESWHGMNLPSTLLFSVTFSDANTGYMAGYRSTCNCGLLMTTRDGGVTWYEHPFPSETPTYSFGFYTVIFTNPMTGYLSGYNSALLKSTDGGVTWKRGSIASSNDVFRVLAFGDANTGYAAGGDDFSLMDRVYKTTDAGDTWTLLRDYQKTISIGGFAFTDANTGFMVGNGDSEGGGLISKTTDGGATWKRVYKGASQEVLQGVRFISPMVGYAVGTDGVILKTVDAGETWTHEQSPTSNVLTGIAPQKNGSVYIIGFDGTVLKQSGSASVATNGGKLGLATIAPNPFTSKAIVRFDDMNLSGEWTMALYNAMGEDVQHIAGRDNEPIVLDRESLPAGTYFYRIIKDGDVLARGVVGVR